jgi:hypothetical protein
MKRKRAIVITIMAVMIIIAMLIIIYTKNKGKSISSILINAEFKTREFTWKQ